ncbi:hypothetical protein Patl1_21347 [Pistacia atlantica]|uniref:Uncharacterized protein n=1 Tax=Pistacia atlantica TaxID=434234 RepID=A0ACC1BLD9_9ROSI|nr:hypothetical protein Patl1_21347 [Pistacia atlantica]
MENSSASRLGEGKRRDHQSSEEEEETFEVNDYEEDQDNIEADEAVAGNVGKRKVEGPFPNGSVS